MRRMILIGLAAALLASPAVAAPKAAPTVAQQLGTLKKEVAALRAHAAKHAWPDLTVAEKSALARVLKTIPKGVKFDIICNTASCDDLAEDIDDALESSDHDSALDRSLAPIGYGVAVQVN